MNIAIFRTCRLCNLGPRIQNVRNFVDKPPKKSEADKAGSGGQCPKEPTKKNAACKFDGKLVGTCKPVKIEKKMPGRRKPGVKMVCKEPTPEAQVVEDDCQPSLSRKAAPPTPPPPAHMSPESEKPKKEVVEEEKGEGSPRIAILGAGMAGLSAASLLFRSGLQSTYVFEGSKRIGGRVYSAKCGDIVNEFGVEWLEGEFNSVLRLASQQGLTLSEETNKPAIYMTDQGIPIKNYAVQEATTQFKNILNKAVDSFVCSRETDLFDVSLQDFITCEASRIQWSDCASRTLFNDLCHIGSCYLGGQLSLLSLNDVALKFRSDYKTRIKEGIASTLEPMLRDVPSSNIKLGRRVQTIKWDESPVKLVFHDCSEDHFDMVVVTFSLGVLKNDAELFEPELPESKLEAIRNTGYEVVNKLFLDYEDPFWLEGHGRMFISRAMNHTPDTWEDAVFEINEICGSTSGLQLSLCGPPAINLERDKEDDIAKKITMLLRKSTGVDITPFPLAVSRTSWAHDPLFMGSVSYMGKTTNQKHLVTLSQPLPPLHPVPKLYFAGDATAGGYMGTVQGARVSGFREALRIIDIVDTRGWPPKPNRNLNEFLQGIC